MDDVTVYRGSACILDRIQWRVEPGQSWALLGTNGAGKSTLLQAIAGDLDYQEGTLVLLGGGGGNGEASSALGYLRQTAVAGSHRSVYEEACAGMTEVNDAERALEHAQAEAMANNDWEAVARATERLDALGGFR